VIFQSGQSLTMQSWVNGSSNQAVSWSANAGTFSGATYTPPTVTAPTAVTLTATAAASSLAKTNVIGWVIPAGVIRIDVGSRKPYADAAGNVWLADTLGFESDIFSTQNDNYPSNSWGAISDAPLYQTYNYTWGSDIIYGPFAVPNGSYAVTYYFGHGGCSGTFDPAAINNGNLNAGPLALDVNGSQTTFNVSQAERNTCRTPATATVTATVTNNLLTVAVRSTSSAKAQSSPYLNALSIVPRSNSVVSVAAH